MLQDRFGKPINDGDHVYVLVKETCYRGIRNAHLYKAVYIHKGQYGHEFVDESRYDDYLTSNRQSRFVYRIRNPECVLIGPCEMSSGRLLAILNNVLAWGSEHTGEFFSCLVNAMQLTDKEKQILNIQ